MRYWLVCSLSVTGVIALLAFWGHDDLGFANVAKWALAISIFVSAGILVAVIRSGRRTKRSEPSAGSRPRSPSR